VAYPVEVLPSWLSQLSLIIPITHALKAMRHALLQGYSLLQLWPELMILAIFAVFFFPLGLLAFHLAVQQVKVTGTLGHY
jgi:ABC-2 type transport system permease protein